MENPTGETTDGALGSIFDRKLPFQFRGSVVTFDAGLLAQRELDDTHGLSAMAADILAEERTGKYGRHALVGLLQAYQECHPVAYWGEGGGYLANADLNLCCVTCPDAEPVPTLLETL
jgi:hypothetical protein